MLKGDKVFHLDEEYQSDFIICSNGKFEVPKVHFMPNVRHIPTFPEREINLTESWNAEAIEIIKVNNAPNLTMALSSDYLFANIETNEEGKKNAFAARLSLAFPPYSKMKELPYIKFMEGRPYLLPLGWIYRIIYNLKNRKEYTKSANKNLSDRETLKCAQDEINYFEEIGLI